MTSSICYFVLLSHLFVISCYDTVCYATSLWYHLFVAAHHYDIICYHFMLLWHCYAKSCQYNSVCYFKSHHYDILRLSRHIIMASSVCYFVVMTSSFCHVMSWHYLLLHIIMTSFICDFMSLWQHWFVISYLCRVCLLYYTVANVIDNTFRQFFVH